jgi:hypothetical protein
MQWHTRREKREVGCKKGNWNELCVEAAILMVLAAKCGRSRAIALRRLN